MATVAELLRATAGIPGDSPSRDIEILLGHCLGKSRTWLYTWPETAVAEADAQRFAALKARRCRGEPVAYLVGEREFWSLNLRVDPSTLIPRPDTETLVEWALQLDLAGDSRVLDLGTGTGAIALALATERPHWRVTGADANEAAVNLARTNASSNHLSRVQFQVSDWFSSLLTQRFDLVVSNPPYIAADDCHLSQGDVRFEPRSALVAADNGLADLAQIVSGAPDALEPGGWLLLEHGFDQGEAVRALLQQRGFVAIETRADLAGQERVSGGCWNAD